MYGVYGGERVQFKLRTIMCFFFRITKSVHRKRATSLETSKKVTSLENTTSLKTTLKLTICFTKDATSLEIPSILTTHFTKFVCFREKEAFLRLYCTKYCLYTISVKVLKYLRPLLRFLMEHSNLNILKGT